MVKKKQKTTLAVGRKQKTNSDLLCWSPIGFADPSTHPNLFPLWTMWLYNNVSQLPPWLPMDKSHNYNACKRAAQMSFLDICWIDLSWSFITVLSEEFSKLGRFSGLLGLVPGAPCSLEGKSPLFYLKKKDRGKQTSPDPSSLHSRRKLEYLEQLHHCLIHNSNTSDHKSLEQTATAEAMFPPPQRIFTVSHALNPHLTELNKQSNSSTCSLQVTQYH